MKEGKKKILCKSVQSMATLSGLRELRGIRIGLTYIFLQISFNN